LESPNFSIIVPTYNSEVFIKNTLSILIAFKSDRDEIVVVDDCSTDATLDQITAFGDAVVLIALLKNVGQHKATKIGLDKAKGQFAITIDDDLPIPTNGINSIQNTCNARALVYAQYIPVDKSRIRLWMSALVNALAKRNYQLDGKGSSTRGFDLTYYKSNRIAGKSDSYLDHELLQIFSDVSFIKVPATSNTAKSRYNLYKLARHFYHFIKG
jgi:glycosyltransferase involved in cell wall biosynthesis